MPNNSLLNPPTTIQVGNNTDDNDIPKEVKASKDRALFAPDNIENTTGSPDIDRVIQGFQFELDTLSRSFDLLATSHSQSKTVISSTEKSSTTHTTPINHRNPYRSSVPCNPTPAQKHIPTRSDPLEFADIPSHLRSSTNITPPRGVNTTGIISTKRNKYSGDNHADAPPRPVDTPSLFFSEKNKERVPSGTPSRYNASEKEYLSRNDCCEVAICKMKETLNEQDCTIRQLQRENNDLRRQLLLAQGATYDTTIHMGKQQRKSRPNPMVDGSVRLRNLDNPYDRTQQPERYYDEMRPTLSSLSTFRSTQLSTPPRDEDENTLETATRAGTVYPGFTPGTKFVAVSTIRKATSLF